MDNEQNLFESLLSSVDAATRLPNANLVVIGDKHSGKRALLEHLRTIDQCILGRGDVGSNDGANNAKDMAMDGSGLGRRRIGATAKKPTLGALSYQWWRCCAHSDAAAAPAAPAAVAATDTGTGTIARYILI